MGGDNAITVGQYSTYVIYCMGCDDAMTVGRYSTMLKLYGLWQCYHCGAIFYKVINCMVCDNDHDVTVGQYSTKL